MFLVTFPGTCLQTQVMNSHWLKLRELWLISRWP